MSHDKMATFFSSTDQATLKEQGEKTVNFASLIVNDEGKYTAAITRKVDFKGIQKVTATYNLFSVPSSYSSEKVVEYSQIQYIEMEIEKHSAEIFDKEYTDRFTEIESSASSYKNAPAIPAATPYYARGYNYEEDDAMPEAGYKSPNKEEDLPFCDEYGYTSPAKRTEKGKKPKTVNVSIYAEQAKTDLARVLGELFLDCEDYDNLEDLYYDCKARTDKDTYYTSLKSGSFEDAVQDTVSKVMCDYKASIPYKTEMLKLMKKEKLLLMRVFDAETFRILNGVIIKYLK